MSTSQHDAFRYPRDNGIEPGSMATYYTHTPSVYNNNSNVNHLYGSGSIYNHNHNITNYVDARPSAPPTPYISEIAVSAALPGKPILFRGREKLVNDLVALLTADETARLAILGSGGMGKTTVALVILHDSLIVSKYDRSRYFVSCEALVDADAIVVSLAKVLKLPASSDLLTDIVVHLTSSPRTLLVLDNLETVWLVNGAPVAAVDELLGRLAQIPSLSLIVTCRGSFLSELSEWSNGESAILEPFSLEAALQTFQDKSGRRLIRADMEIARELLNAVDRMPLAVALLGQLARRGNTVSDLLARWNREHISLLHTHETGRRNSVAVSIELSVTELVAADASTEALHLLSICSMLPDGLRANVFERLRPLFGNIDRARDRLILYALADFGVDGVLRTISPIRRQVLALHPAIPVYSDALHSIYFDIADQLPTVIDEYFQRLACLVVPEMSNLSALLLTLVGEPSDRVVEAVIRFTDFMRFSHQPTTTLASALLPRIEHRPMSRARCLRSIGHAQYILCEYKSAIESASIASQLYLELGDRGMAASCMNLAAQAHRFLHEYDVVEDILQDIRVVYAELGDKRGEADCRTSLGELMRAKGDRKAAVKHLDAARQTFNSLQEAFAASQCSIRLGSVYAELDDLVSAAAELEAARSVLDSLGDRPHHALSTLFLGGIRRRQGNLELAEQLLLEVEVYLKARGMPNDVAGCALELGYLRRDQGRRVQAVAQFNKALRLYEALGVVKYVEVCRKHLSIT